MLSDKLIYAAAVFELHPVNHLFTPKVELKCTERGNLICKQQLTTHHQIQHSQNKTLAGLHARAEGEGCVIKILCESSFGRYDLPSKHLLFILLSSTTKSSKKKLLGPLIFGNASCVCLQTTNINFFSRMETRGDKTHTCGTICLKYLLFLFNILFWLAGGAVLAVGVWTLVEKTDYISLLNSNLYSASAYILIAAGVIVIVTGMIGCCATLKEMRSLLIVYLVLLFCIFLVEIIAGVLAYINYQECFPFCHQLDAELKQNLQVTMQQKYQQPGEESLTQAVDKLQQEFMCCGSYNSSDWTDSVWIQAAENHRLVPDSCCKTPSELCGLRDHPSNIYKGGCIMKLEEFIRSQLYILGAVGIGIAFLQLVGMMFTCCLYRNLKEDPY
ncbi:CD151 antigen isoform X2 [Leuresthes tenuis]|uniref:CD151 antigen isoform X2 n=1 Tax=Leuresthes tenuis TaxID=355514 RepID=UPI003B513AA6